MIKTEDTEFAANGKSLVMVVDDLTDNVDIISRMLEASGYRTAGYASGLKALEDLEQNAVEPDILLLDVSMPEIDGFEITRQIRKNPQIRRFPIVLLTALRDEQARSQGIQAGADEFLSKPTARLELLARVTALLHFQHGTDELRRKTEEISRLNNELKSNNASFSRELEVLRGTPPLETSGRDGLLVPATFVA